MPPPSSKNHAKALPEKYICKTKQIETTKPVVGEVIEVETYKVPAGRRNKMTVGEKLLVPVDM